MLFFSFSLFITSSFLSPTDWNRILLNSYYSPATSFFFLALGLPLPLITTSRPLLSLSSLFSPLFWLSPFWGKRRSKSTHSHHPPSPQQKVLFLSGVIYWSPAFFRSARTQLPQLFPQGTTGAGPQTEPLNFWQLASPTSSSFTSPFSPF